MPFPNFGRRHPPAPPEQPATPGPLHHWQKKAAAWLSRHERNLSQRKRKQLFALFILAAVAYGVGLCTHLILPAASDQNMPAPPPSRAPLLIDTSKTK